MPTLSIFYGIMIRMNHEHGGQHNTPHIHVKYAEHEAVYDLNGNLISGNLPKKQRNFIETWITLREDDLKTNWNLIQSGENFYKIEPLK